MLEIPILGRKISVRFASDKDLANLAKDSECWGYYENEVITLSSSLNHEHARKILMHELAHAVLKISGISNLLEEKQEEAICDAFETYVDVFRDEEFIKFMNAKDED
jgi:hypothetical protein